MDGGAVREETRRGRSVFGTSVGGYRVIDELARGGMGVVYLGEHPVLGSNAALKVLKERYAQMPEMVSRFELEARAQARVASGRVVRLFDFAPFPDGRSCLVMEHVTGKNLERELERRGRLTPQEAARVLLQAAAALADVHRAKVIHCDLKAENLVLTATGLKLLDFGLARIAGERPPSGAVLLGTPQCMAPEQVTAQEIDFRADVYSVGILAYRLFTGRYPFVGGSPSEVMLKHLREPPPPPEGMPPRLAQVVLGALAKRREERFADAQALFEALKRAVQPHRAPVPVSQRLPPPVAALAQAPPTSKPEGNALLSALQRYQTVASRDHYTFLRMAPDAEPATIRAAIEKARVELEEARKVAGAETARFDALLLRADAAQELLTPEGRARYDAALGNFRGVARAVRDGLSPEALLRLQGWFAAAHPARVANARRAAEEAEKALSAGSSSRAGELLERALSQDPLELRLHQRYWRLRNAAAVSARQSG